MLVPLLKNNGKYTLIDSSNFSLKGKKEYDFLDFFFNGYAIAKRDGKFFYIDYKEHVLKLDFEYSQIERFNNNIAAVKRDDEFRFINKNGIEITRDGYDYYWTHETHEHLREGFMEVQKRAGSQLGWDDNNIPYICASHYNIGLIDASGFEIIPPENSDFLIHVEDDFVSIVHENFRKEVFYKTIDFNGKPIGYSYEFSSVTNFYCNKAVGILRKTNEAFIIDKYFSKIKSLGVKKIDELGIQNFYEDFSFSYPSYDTFINGLYPIKNNGQWGLINLLGEIVCNYKYDYIYPLRNSLIIVGKIILDTMKFSLLNANFEEIIPFQYDFIKPFSEGVTIVKLNMKWGVIDEKGKEIISPQYTLIDDCKNGFIKVSIGDYDNDGIYHGLYGLFNIKGKKVCPIIYQSIGELNFKFMMAKKDNKLIVFDIKGLQNLSLSNKYDEILEYYNGFYLVKKLDKIFVVEETGQEFVDDRLEKLDELLF